MFNCTVNGPESDGLFPSGTTANTDPGAAANVTASTPPDPAMLMHMDPEHAPTVRSAASYPVGRSVTVTIVPAGMRNCSTTSGPFAEHDPLPSSVRPAVVPE